MFDTYWGDSGSHAIATVPSPNPSSSSAPNEPSSGASVVVGSSSSGTGVDTVGNPPVFGDDPETPAFSSYDVAELDDDTLDGDEYDDLGGDMLDDVEDVPATDPHGPSHPAPGTSHHATEAAAVIQPSDREQKRKELETKIAELRQGHGFGPPMVSQNQSYKNSMSCFSMPMVF